MILLHIGLHKTGTTSIQRFLYDHRDRLDEAGYGLFESVHDNAYNHSELNMACLRDGRDSFGTYKYPDLVIDDGYRADVARRGQAVIEAHDRAIFSNEGLSWLRHEDEMQRLVALLGGRRDAVRVIVFLRDKADYLRSYARQIVKVPGRVPSLDRESVLYVGDDSWLLDHDRLVDLYEGAFGRENLIVLDYDKELAQVGSVIPGFVAAAGLDVLRGIDCSGYFYNRS